MVSGIDTIGKPDTRIMLWKNVYGPHQKMGYKVYESEEAISKDWDMTVAQ